MWSVLMQRLKFLFLTWSYALVVWLQHETSFPLLCRVRCYGLTREETTRLDSKTFMHATPFNLLLDHEPCNLPQLN
ncbi:hypothetical protein VNO77_38948 [Canavalia gladiata]|uniref:Secreted protein n=1 Tax=Canavalia gladiata TaxID=3824 RepID=A0AAN9K9J0_CANGL